MSRLPPFLQISRERVATAPLVWTERAIREADAGAEYFGNGLRILADERGIERPEFLRQANVAAQAFRAHADWLRNDLSEHSVPFEPAGAEAFDRYLQKGHFLPAEQNSQWWFDHARAQLIEATEEMQELAEAIDPKRSWKEQLAEIPDASSDRGSLLPIVWGGLGKPAGSRRSTRSWSPGPISRSTSDRSPVPIDRRPRDCITFTTAALRRLGPTIRIDTSFRRVSRI